MILVIKLTNIIFIVFANFVFVISFHATRLTRPQTNWWQCHISTGLKQGVLGFNYKWLSLIQRCYQQRLIVLYWYCVQSTQHVCWTLIFCTAGNNITDCLLFNSKVSKTGIHPWSLTSRMETSLLLSRLTSELL